MKKWALATLAVTGLSVFSTAALADKDVFPVNLSFKVLYEDNTDKGTKVGSVVFNNNSLIRIVNGGDPTDRTSNPRGQVLAVGVYNFDGDPGMCPIELMVWDTDEDEQVGTIGCITESESVQNVANDERSRTGFSYSNFTLALNLPEAGPENVFSLEGSLTANAAKTQFTRTLLRALDRNANTAISSSLVTGSIHGFAYDSEDEETSDFDLIVSGGSFRVNLKKSLGTIVEVVEDNT